MKKSYIKADLFLEDLAEHIYETEPTGVCISTYGEYSAIQNWPRDLGDIPFDKMNPVQKILTYMDKKNIQSGVVVGNEKVTHLKTDMREYPNIRWMKNPKNHSKLYILTYGGNKTVWVGSVNLSGSNNWDTMMEATDKEVIDHFIGLYGILLKESRRIR